MDGELDNDEKKKARRAARFAADASMAPPPPPKRSFAHPGGKMTSNKEEATRKYLARKGDSLNAAQRAALAGIDVPAAAGSAATDRVDKLFVGNLPFSMSSAGLGKLFAGRFDVKGAKIVADRATNRSKGYGFVTFETEADASEALRAFAGTQLEGRPLSVKFATQRGAKPEAVVPSLAKNAGWGSWAKPPPGPAAEAPKEAPLPSPRPVAQAEVPPEPEERAGAPLSPMSNLERAEALGDALDAAEALSPRAAKAALNVEKPPDPGAVEAVTLWKVAVPADVDAWAASGTLSGSDLDARDGFLHFSNATMVKKVAALFFKGQPAKLLRVDPDVVPEDAEWVDEKTSDASLLGRPGTRVRALPDGCLHVHAKPPFPFPFCDVYDLPLADDGETHVFPPECVITEGPKPQTIGGFTISY